MLFLGADIGGTNLKVGILNAESGGHLIGDIIKESLPGDRRTISAVVVVEKVIALAQRLLDEQHIRWHEILFVGVACPGQIDRERGVVVAASSFPSWSNEPLASLVQDSTGRPVTILNDASAAASGEFVERGSQETIAVLTLGTGIGLGVVCAGRVATGCRGLIEGGHMIVEPGPEARLCGCGQRGCLEAYASASAVAAIAFERLGGALPFLSSATAAGGAPASDWGPLSPSTAPAVPTEASPGVSKRKVSIGRSDSAVSLRIMELERRTSGGEGGSVAGTPSPSPRPPKGAGPAAAAAAAAKITAADVFAMARQGDEVAVRVVEETCDYLGLACVNICRVLDPDAILLTGGMSKAEGLVEKVRESFHSRGWSVLPHECEINLASTSVAAGVVGAAGAAVCEHALATGWYRRRSSEGGGGGIDGAGNVSSVDWEESRVGKWMARGGWGFLIGVGVGVLMSSVAAAAVVSSRSGRMSSSRSVLR